MLVSKLDSNITGLRIAKESTPKVLPGSPIWRPMEPNAPDNIGTTIGQVARNPINADRQNLRGVMTSLDATAGFDADFTGNQHEQAILEGFYCADLRRAPEFGDVPNGGTGAFTSVTGANQYAAASGLTIFPVGALVFASGFTTANNNGLKRVTVSAAALLTVAETLVAEASPPAASKLVMVGFRASVGDLDIDASLTFPAITSTALNFATTLSFLVPGEWIFRGGGAVVGGGDVGVQFTNAANNGFARIRSIAAGRLEYDKCTSPSVTEANTTSTVEIYFGRVLKNELAALQKHYTYQAEQTLGAPDDASPSQIQSQYVLGMSGNVFSLNVPAEDKMTNSLSWVGLDGETRTGVVGVKSGTRPVIEALQAFNTSSDPRRIRFQVVAADEAPSALFNYATAFTVEHNNNVQKNPAIGVLGAIGVSKGNFVVSGSMEPYFTSTAQIDAIRANSDITIDMICVKQGKNTGFALDLPLCTLSEGYVQVEQDNPLKQNVSFMASTGQSLTLSTSLNHTAMLCFFDFLPTLAQVQA